LDAFFVRFFADFYRPATVLAAAAEESPRKMQNSKVQGSGGGFEGFLPNSGAPAGRPAGPQKGPA
jgi:hypothetical protein